MRVLFGGSFDPVHHGHIGVVSDLRDLGASVFMLVSVNPPYRGAPLASTEQRMAMLRLAVGGDTDVRIERGDRVCASPYTIDVLRNMRASLGEASPLAWALGADQYAHLDTWRDWRGLIELAHLIVFPRPRQHEPTHLEVSERMDACRAPINQLFNLPCGCVAEMKSVPPEVSSTEIRNRLKIGQSVAGKLPESVFEYIRSQRLYGMA